MTTQSYQSTVPPSAPGTAPVPKAEKSGKFGFALMLFAGFLIVFIVGVLAGGVQWWLLTQYQKGQTATQQPKPNWQQPATSATPSTTTGTADNASKELSQRVANASHDERQPIAEALAIAENTFPTDYRFPFEHAKLVVSGNVHHHAFGLLYMAATRAIDAGKADQMLTDVEKERDGAFYRCSRGHDEWNTLEASLKGKDKGKLQSAMSGMRRDLIGGADDMVMDY